MHEQASELQLLPTPDVPCCECRGSNQTISPTDVTDSNRVVLTQNRRLDVQASSLPTQVIYSGTRVDYTYTISNPGNVMVRNIQISAPGVGPLTCNSTSTGAAAPDASFTNMTVYQVVVCRWACTRCRCLAA